jgi:hypothetical protein
MLTYLNIFMGVFVMQRVAKHSPKGKKVELGKKKLSLLSNAKFVVE